MSQFDQVTVLKKSNVYFDGKCVSHTVVFNDGTRKTVGVILPSSLTFNTGSPEKMEIIYGTCRVKLKDADEWSTYSAGESFDVPGQSAFEIATDDVLDYVCHFE
jgi:uncharacterized protein YaiE (UPF0345 family)